MNSKLLLVVAALLGVLVVFLVNRKIGELEAKANPPTTTFYQARVDVKAGTNVQAAAAEGYLQPVRGIPAAFSRAFPEAVDEDEFAMLAKAETVRRPLAAGEFLMQRHLEAVSDVEVLVAIPEGEIAFAFPVSSTGAVAYLVSAGDVVDIYRIAEAPDPTVPGGTTAKAMKVAEDIRVFAVDGKAVVREGAGGADRGRTYQSVTVTGPPSRIEALMVEATKGPLQMVLKSRRRTS